MKILIVDDEVDICFLFKSLLKIKEGITCEATYTLSDGFELIENFEPGILFLDNHLPDGMGIQAISKIKKQKPEIKIVMISAYDTAHDRNLAMTCGADAFVSKPFTRDTIYKVLDNLEATG